MSEEIEVVFLGINPIGISVYEWLCDREAVSVSAVVSRKSQLPLLERLEPDYAVSCGFGHVVPERYLDAPREAFLNLHLSYLPHNRGVYPNLWTVVEDIPVGVTIHHMAPRVDTGDILVQDTVEATFSDTAQSVTELTGRKLLALFAEAWPEIVSGRLSGTPQDPQEGSFHHSSEVTQLQTLAPDAEVRVKEFLDRLRALDHPAAGGAEITVDGEQYTVEVDITRQS